MYYTYLAIPLGDVETSENVSVIVPSHGGHIAFLKDLTPDGPGLTEEILAQFSQAVFQNL